MIIIDCEQGSHEWRMARLAKPTASNFDKIITAKKMEASSSRFKYAHKLIAEGILGMPIDDGGASAFMERGQLVERNGKNFYEMKRDVDIEDVGFVTTDDGRCGCSPDGFVGANGLFELKCPSLPIHLAYLLDDDGIDYKAQVQGQLWICEREWCDTVSFCPGNPSQIVRVPRDDRFIKAMTKHVDDLCEYIDSAREKLIQRGYKREDLFNDALARMAA